MRHPNRLASQRLDWQQNPMFDRSPHRFVTGIVLPAMVCVAMVCVVAGCGDSAKKNAAPPSPAPGSTGATADAEEANSSAAAKPVAPSIPQTYEAAADDLLSMRLPIQESRQGWVRLFDGHTLFGWEIAGKANWRIENNAIVVDGGDRSLLCTSMPWSDYELELQFRADPETNSGIFLRTPLQPTDPGTECYEVNIAPPSNAFPTGMLVKRAPADQQRTTPTSGDWQTLNINANGDKIEVSIDGEAVNQWSDPNPLTRGRIGLQHNQGRVEFRDVRVRPLGMKELIDEKLTQWKSYPDMPGEFRYQDGSLRIEGGKNQLETRDSYADFVLLAHYELDAPETNTGIFFRCIPGDEMMGYECQVNDARIDDNPLAPADTGTGGIFRRQQARVVAGDHGQPNAVLLVADGLHMAAWVNGIQVSDWYDDRQPNENPRRGSRTKAGTVIIQAHDSETKATYHSIQIAAIESPSS
ncbi:MAG: DUF1080 domain-containing protein [Planctomycetota bacterium]